MYFNSFNSNLVCSCVLLRSLMYSTLVRRKRLGCLFFVIVVILGLGILLGGANFPIKDNSIIIIK